MNLPSLEKYEHELKPGGVLVLNQSMITREPRRKDVLVVKVPGNEIAEQLGDRRMTNMVLLGALLANLVVLPIAAVEKSLQAHLPARHQRLLALNFQCLRRGAEFAAVKIGSGG
jgi:2-oxoglutarate ferredoxin oxidoreductase subunit gamma